VTVPIAQVRVAPPGFAVNAFDLAILIDVIWSESIRFMNGSWSGTGDCRYDKPVAGAVPDKHSTRFIRVYAVGEPFYFVKQLFG